MEPKKRKISTAGILGIGFVLAAIVLLSILYGHYFSGNQAKSDVIILDSANPESSQTPARESTVTQPPTPSSPDAASTSPAPSASTGDNTSNFNDTGTSDSPQSSNYQNVTEGNFDER